jgi:hypothetical protein
VGSKAVQTTRPRHSRCVACSARRSRADRYHVRSINSVRQTRHVLNHVLNNWRKHGHDRGGLGLHGGRIDPFSSGVWFAGWKERTKPIAIPDGKRARAISVYEVPAS